MTRICPNCGYSNQDDYKHCCKCGTSLLKIRKSSLALVYAVTIFLSWGGLLIPKGLFIIFCGMFFPFFLLQSRHSELKKHGYILFLISIIGIILTVYFTIK